MPPTNSQITQLPNGIQGIYRNCVLLSPGLRIHGGSASPLAQAHTIFGYRQNGTFPAAVAADTDMAALTGGNLAFDNGSQPQSTLSCRVYTFLVDGTSGTNVFSVIAGTDFPKHRNQYETDVALGDGTKTIIGFLSIKNESSAVFIPGTTNLDATGITAIFSNAYGYVVA